MTRIALCIAPALLLAACASAPEGTHGKPYAIFQPETKVIGTGGVPGYIIKIDGQSIPLNRFDPVEPGMRTVELALTGPQGTAVEKTYSIQVDAKPCTRYYFALKQGGSGGAWSAFVSGTERIGECASRFGG
jgi:hypothetical protein